MYPVETAVVGIAVALGIAAVVGIAVALDIADVADIADVVCIAAVASAFAEVGTVELDPGSIHRRMDP